jgi:hypothetical protein
VPNALPVEVLGKERELIVSLEAIFLTDVTALAAHVERAMDNNEKGASRETVAG